VIHSPLFNREPLATEGSIAGNPLHAEFLEIAAMARHDFILDVTLTSIGASRRFCLEIREGARAGVEFTETSCLENLDELADAVITCGAATHWI